MLDLILTNNFGRSISLTGHGASNTFAKIAFKNLQIYKIMTS